MEQDRKLPPRLRVTEPTPTQIIEEDLLYGVVTAAAIAENLRPGIWQDITTAMCQGASKTKTGSLFPYSASPYLIFNIIFGHILY